jgi:hypothetical protein
MVPSNRERFVERSRLRAGYLRLTSQRKDVGLAWEHYTSDTNPTTRVEIAGFRLQNFTALPVILFFVVARRLSISC